MQDRLEDVNKCFVEDLAKKFRRPPTCALVTHDGDFQDIARRVYRAGKKHSALQEEIDGHDVVVRFSDWWNGNGAYGNKTTFRVYSRIGAGLQNFEGDMFAKRDMVKSSINASDGYVVLWNEGMNSCKDRL